MLRSEKDYGLLLSLPPNMCRYFEECEPELAERAFATFDPPERQLGSGGGTAYLLEQAWKDSGSASFDEWLELRKKLIIHGGGESRRLPAYGPSGKLFTPIPAFRWARGQNLDQNLLEVATPTLEAIADRAAETSKVMIASGDVFVRLTEELPSIPDADVILFGIWVSPEQAKNFGVMFSPPGQPEKLAKFLQKPSMEEIQRQSQEYTFLIDIGIWMLSKRAVNLLMERCLWDATDQRFENDTPDTYDLYGSWAENLGTESVSVDFEIADLSTAIVPIPGAEFYHFGTGSDLLESVYDIQNIVSDQSRLGAVPSFAQPRIFVQNSDIGITLDHTRNESVWIENSSIPGSWSFNKKHIITGVPKNDWTLDLEEGICLDFVPTDTSIVFRPYGYDDPFRGRVDDQTTIWMGQSLIHWMEERDILFSETSGIETGMDIFDAALFPVVETMDERFFEWMISTRTAQDSSHKDLYLNAERLSARQLNRICHLPSLYDQRRELRTSAMKVMADHAEQSVFYKLNLEKIAIEYANSGHRLPDELDQSKLRDPLLAVHNCMFRSHVQRIRGDSHWKKSENSAQKILRELVTDPLRKKPVKPRFDILPDQIVWGRSPVRMDFAGGWTDTPPFCMEQGGNVLNIAIDINGQPPIQVFARKTKTTDLVLKSIDQGMTDRIHTYEQILSRQMNDVGFDLARMALAVSGFHPEFNGRHHRSLDQQLSQMGGGLELTMLAAVPKGSGLGTSSILAATMLGVLSDCCKLGWTREDLVGRTLAVEQLLGSGGGWQDQVGGVFPGLKLASTTPGVIQSPTLRWLPDEFFVGENKKRMLLYYTGVTRVAHNILGEIVRGFFLNSTERLDISRAISANALYCHESIHRSDFESFADSVRRSWELNQSLDSGTNPERIQSILKEIAIYTSAVKLLGAGGGGYLFIIARTNESADYIRQILGNFDTEHGARLVDFTISNTGLQVTRS